jgi:hypothetical protein
MNTSVSNLFSHIQSGQLLGNLFSNGNITVLPTNGGWTQTVAGSGSSGQTPSFLYVSCGSGINSSASLSSPIVGLSNITNKTYINWDIPLHISFSIIQFFYNTQVVSYTQLKNSYVQGPISSPGLGIRIDNHTMWGESYGTTLGSSSLGDIRNDILTKIDIILTPEKRVEYWVDNVLKTIHTNLSFIPSGETGALDGSINATFMHSIKNGNSDTQAVYYYLKQPVIWQGE